ncbi:Alpha/Beta hydrolase protein [Cyathus striatus]|nr:Alpha/Beta hydrolase protein [Cyathus striatus]
MSTTSTVEFKLKDKVYQTWYTVYGDLKGGKRPLVALHGGPGMTHHYMLPHKILFEKYGIPVVFYDQIGNGKSSHALDEPKEFWTPEVFVHELENLLQHLGISSDFDLLGQSWGGMLAAIYASSRTPAGLKRIIIANSPADMVKFAQGTNALFAKSFPAELVSRMTELYKTGQGESDEYKLGLMQFFKKNLCTLDPWPKELLDSLMAAETNGNVYKTMLGLSVLHPTGYLKNWTHKIRAPMLLISSPNDEVQEEAIIPYFLNTPKVKWVEIPTTTHTPMFEDPEKYFAAILAFLESVH